MTTRTQLWRHARKYGGDINTAKLIATRAISFSDGHTCAPGDDVTERARGLKMLRRMIRLGRIKCIPDVDFRTVPSDNSKAPPKSPLKDDEITKPNLIKTDDVKPADETKPRLVFSGASPLSEITRTLDDAGIPYPPNATRKKLLQIARKARREG